MRLRPPPTCVLSTLFAVVVVVVAGLAIVVASSPAASSSVVVSMDVVSATELDIAGCATGSPATAFGTVQPDAEAVTQDCVIEFGSSNDTSSLRIRQTDGAGAGMWRLPNGDPDSTYQGDGMGDEPATVDSPWWGRGGVWHVLDDGTTYVAGHHNNDTMVYRFEPDGDLDFGWAGDGSRLVTQTHGGAVLTVASDGKVYVIGRTTMGYITGVRLHPDGTLDSNVDADPAESCDTDGAFTINAPPGLVDVPPSSATLDPGAGRLYIGFYGNNGSNNDMGVVALDTSDCTVDTDFSGDGFSWHDFGNYEGTMRILVADDGDVILVGDRNAETPVVRLRQNGDAETDFSGGGSDTYSFSGFPENPNASLLHPDGRILIAQYVEYCGGCDSQTLVFAVRPDGTLDPGFGTGGWSTFDVDPAEDDRPMALQLDSAGNVLVAGIVDIGGDTAPYLARLSPTGQLDTTFGTDGFVTSTITAGRAHGVNAIFEVADGRWLVGHRIDVDGAQDRFAPQRLATVAVDEYQDGVSDWDTASTGHFGVCLASTTGTPAWPTNAACAQTSDPWWRALPATSTVVATESTPVVQQAEFRFGVRTEAGQSPGTYVAPVTFEVVAPA